MIGTECNERCAFKATLPHCLCLYSACTAHELYYKPEPLQMACDRSSPVDGKHAIQNIYISMTDVTKVTALVERAVTLDPRLVESAAPAKCARQVVASSKGDDRHRRRRLDLAPLDRLHNLIDFDFKYESLMRGALRWQSVPHVQGRVDPQADCLQCAARTSSASYPATMQCRTTATQLTAKALLCSQTGCSSAATSVQSGQSPQVARHSVVHDTRTVQLR